MSEESSEWTEEEKVDCPSSLGGFAVEEWRAYFTNDSTIHGCRVICGPAVFPLRRSQSKAAANQTWPVFFLYDSFRLIWLGVFIASSAFFGIMIIKRVGLYLDDPINVCPM